MTTSDVPFNDLSRTWAPVADRVEAAVSRVIRSGWYLLGPETETFEAEFATFCGVGGCAAVGNGTDALEIALRSIGCETGDEVILTANAGMYATVACLAVGATPVYVDVDERSLLLDAESAAAAVTTRTKAVVATHLYGNVVDVDDLRTRLPAHTAIVEDAAQAHGATLAGTRVGSLGDVAAFSFYPTKNLGAMGDAGAVVSRDAALVERARALRQYGWESRHVAVVPGGRNSRMDEIQAAILCELLPEVTTRNEARASIRARYVEAVGDRLPFVDAGDPRVDPATHLCVARSPDRDRLLETLDSYGVSCGVHFAVPDHLQPALSGRTMRIGKLDRTERACREVLSLPCFPELDDSEIESVIAAVKRST